MINTKIIKDSIDSECSAQTAHSLHIFAFGWADGTNHTNVRKNAKHLIRKMHACYPRGRMGKLLRLGKFKINK